MLYMLDEIINTTQQCGNQLNDYVASAFNDLLIKSSSAGHVRQNDAVKAGKSNRALLYIGLALFVMSIFGWMLTDAVWPTVCFGAGIVFAILSFASGKKDGGAKSSAPVAGLPKQEVQDKINNIISHVENEWDATIAANKSKVIAVINSSSLSNDSKFHATMSAQLSGRINFTMLPYVKNILMADTVDDFNGVINDIRSALTIAISDAVMAQIADYQSIKQLVQ